MGPCTCPSCCSCPLAGCPEGSRSSDGGDTVVAAGPLSTPTTHPGALLSIFWCPSCRRQAPRPMRGSRPCTPGRRGPRRRWPRGASRSPPTALPPRPPLRGHPCPRAPPATRARSLPPETTSSLGASCPGAVPARSPCARLAHRRPAWPPLPSPPVRDTKRQVPAAWGEPRSSVCRSLAVQPALPLVPALTLFPAPRAGWPPSPGAAGGPALSTQLRGQPCIPMSFETYKKSCKIVQTPCTLTPHPGHYLALCLLHTRTRTRTLCPVGERVADVPLGPELAGDEVPTRSTFLHGGKGPLSESGGGARPQVFQARAMGRVPRAPRDSPRPASPARPKSPVTFSRHVSSVSLNLKGSLSLWGPSKHL